MIRTYRTFRPICVVSVLAGTILFLMSSCTGSGDGGPSVTVRDSAGITIVESAGGADPSLASWSVETEPSVSIGTLQGDSLQQLFRVGGAARLPDGRFAVANEGTAEVRIYGPDGRFQKALGRRGEGPGEFQQPALAGVLPPDTLVVVDSRLRRITFLHPEDGYLTSAAMAEEAGGAVFPQGMFQDGSVVVGGGFYFSSDSGDQLSNGYSRRSTTYHLVNRNGSLNTDFGEFPGSEFFMRVSSAGGGMSMFARLIPFGKYAMAAVGDDRLYFASGDSWEIRAYASDGALKEIFRLNRPLRPVEPGDLEAYVRERVEEASDPDQAQSIRQDYAEMPVPDFMPAMASIHVDALGCLWVEGPRGPGEPLPRYDILDPQGALVGQVFLPEELELLDVGEDYLLGLHRDELDVEYLRLFPLSRPDPR